MAGRIVNKMCPTSHSDGNTGAVECTSAQNIWQVFVMMQRSYRVQNFPIHMVGYFFLIYVICSRELPAKFPTKQMVFQCSTKEHTTPIAFHTSHDWTCLTFSRTFEDEKQAFTPHSRLTGEGVSHFEWSLMNLIKYWATQSRVRGDWITHIGFYEIEQSKSTLTKSTF